MDCPLHTDGYNAIQLDAMEKVVMAKKKTARKTPAERLTLAERLRAEIMASGLPVGAIAREAGIAQPVLHRFVAGERDLTLRTADKLVDYFGLELHTRRTNR